MILWESSTQTAEKNSRKASVTKASESQKSLNKT